MPFVAKSKHGNVCQFDQEIADEICMKVSVSTRGIRYLCSQNPHWPCFQTIHEWRIKIPSFGEQYARAKCCQIETLTDYSLDLSQEKSQDLIEFTDENGNKRSTGNAVNVARDRLSVDYIKWLACKLAPKIYGDKLQTENNHTVRQEDALKELE